MNAVMKTVVLTLLFAVSSWAQSGIPTSQTEDVLIGVDDVLDIVVLREPELSRSVRVSPAGMITLSAAGSIKAAGLTTSALAAEIQNRLKKDLKNPDVTVELKEFGMQHISVVGAVRTPGEYPVRGSMLLMSVLAKAGSISDTADETIQVFRKSATSAPAAPPVLIPIVDLFRNGKAELNLPIYGGDTVNVVERPAATFVQVVGEVLKAGEVPIRIPNGTTVRQALASAGWFSKDAKKKDAKIIRFDTDNGEQLEIPINLEKVEDASFVDMDLKANDILFIPSKKANAGFSKAMDTAISIATSRLILFGR